VCREGSDFRFFHLILSLALLVTACSHSHSSLKEEKMAMEMKVFSNAFLEGEAIPVKYTCDGQEVSPPLRWHNVPQGARSLALICEDPDAPSGVFVHWILFNLSPTVAELSEGVPTSEALEGGGKQGRNDFKRTGYGGPCPPRHGPHHYFFRLYALDTELRLDAGATKQEVTRAMEGHVLAAGHLMGTYKRK